MTFYGPQPLGRVLHDLELTEATAARQIGVRRNQLGQVLDGALLPTARMVAASSTLTGLPPEDLFTAQVLTAVERQPRDRHTRTATLPEDELARLRRAVGLNPDGRPR